MSNNNIPPNGQNYKETPPQKTELTTFIETLYQSIENKDSLYFELRCIKPDPTDRTKTTVKPRFFSYSDFYHLQVLNDFVHIRRENKQGFNIYLGLYPRLRKKGKKPDIACAPFLFADVDGKDSLEGEAKEQERLDDILAIKRDVLTKIENIWKAENIEPSILIDSGRGFHLYWLLNEPVDFPENGTRDGIITDIEQRNKTLEKVFHGDSVGNVDRVFRLPGTLNRKPVQRGSRELASVPVTIIHFNPDLCYNLDDFPPYQEPQKPHKEGPKIQEPSVKASYQIPENGDKSGFVKAVIETLQEKGAHCFDSYSDFLKIAFACKAEGLPYDVLDSIVRHSDHYNVENNRVIYESLDPKSITFGTAYEYAETIGSYTLKEKLKEIFYKQWLEQAKKDAEKFIQDSHTLKAARLLGGCIAGFAQHLFTDQEAKNFLEQLVKKNSGLPLEKARQDIHDGLLNGKKSPIKSEEQLKNYQKYLDEHDFNPEPGPDWEFYSPPPEDEIPPPFEDENSTGKQEHAQPHQEPEQAPPPDFHYADLGNARRFTRDHNSITKFNHDTRYWYIWDEKRWKQELGTLPTVMKYAKKTVDKIFIEATTHPWDSEKRKELFKWAVQSAAKNRLADMIYLARTEEKISIVNGGFDAYPYLLNCLNGIIDLKTGKLLLHDKGKLLTKLVNIEYDENASCPIWEQAVLSYMGFTDGADPDADHNALELYNFLQKAIGYTLTGDVSEQCLFFLYGDGRNGKSTFINTLAMLLDEFYQHIPIQALMAKKYEGVINNDLAQTPGKRLVVSSEIEEGKQLNESLVKDLTGGDAITARFMRKDPFSFHPAFKIWIFGNDKPVVSPSEALFRRMRLIPFDVQIPKEKDDHHFEEKLKKELPGILSWAVKGCLQWQKEGLSPPAKVTEATQAYRDEMDVLTDFIEENCTVIEGGSELVKVPVKKLYDEYVKWSTNEHREHLSKRDFNKRLHKKYPLLIKKRGNYNILTWFGIGLKAKAEPQQKTQKKKGESKGKANSEEGKPWTQP